MIYKILHRKLNIEQHEPRSDATEEEAVPTPLVTPVMWLIFSIGHEENENLPKSWLQFIHWDTLVHAASLLASTPLNRNAWSEPQALEYRIN